MIAFSCAAWRRADRPADFRPRPRVVSRCSPDRRFDYVIIETVGTGQEAMPFRNKLIDQTVLVMNPDYGARLQLQKIVMLDVADIVVVNKSDLERAEGGAVGNRTAPDAKQAEQRLIVATVAKRHRDPGVDELFEIITRSESVAAFVSNAPDPG